MPLESSQRQNCEFYLYLLDGNVKKMSSHYCHIIKLTNNKNIITSYPIYYLGGSRQTS